MVSLRTKNPFAGGVELLSWKTWVGVGAFAVVAGVVVVMVKAVSTKAEKIGNPIDEIQARLAGLGG